MFVLVSINEWSSIIKQNIIWEQWPHCFDWINSQSVCIFPEYAKICKFISYANRIEQGHRTAKNPILKYRAAYSRDSMQLTLTFDKHGSDKANSKGNTNVFNSSYFRKLSTSRRAENLHFAHWYHNNRSKAPSKCFSGFFSFRDSLALNGFGCFQLLKNWTFDQVNIGFNTIRIQPIILFMLLFLHKHMHFDWVDRSGDYMTWWLYYIEYFSIIPTYFVNLYFVTIFIC